MSNSISQVTVTKTDSKELVTRIFIDEEGKVCAIADDEYVVEVETKGS